VKYEKDCHPLLSTLTHEEINCRPGGG